jgi:hypothetical protein
MKQFVGSIAISTIIKGVQIESETAQMLNTSRCLEAECGHVFPEKQSREPQIALQMNKIDQVYGGYTN